MSDLTENQTNSIYESQNSDPVTVVNSSAQKQQEIKQISADSSQQFQFVNENQSLEVTNSFNSLQFSGQNSQTKPQKATEPKQQQSTLNNQQAEPYIIEQPQLQQTKQFQVLPDKQVNVDEIVSLKIFEKRINDSLQFKNKGNEFFKANQYQQAINTYSEGLRILDPSQFYGATQAQCQKMAEVSASLLFNIGACYFSVNAWKQAEAYYNETIMINPNHIKALYKRALCRYELQNYEQAMSDIKQAFNKDKSNTEIYKSYEKILQKYNEQIKKDKQNLKEMSSRIFRKDSQRSVSQKSENGDKRPESEKEIDGQKIDGQQKGGSLWNLAPLVLVAGAALFMGYKKWFGK